GAKAGVRGDPADAGGKAGLMARYCAEIGPMVGTGRFLTGPDMGTAEEDFAPLRAGRAAPAAITAAVGGVPFEDLLTGYGVAVAADVALSAQWGWGWEGRSVAIEGFGKVGGGVAREVVRRGGRVVAVSTLAGYITDPAGLDVEVLLALRRAHGDTCVARYGRPVGPPAGLFTEVAADVLVPGTRPGVIDGAVARRLPPGVRVVAPAANAPYTADGAAELHRRGVLALPDFVCNAGAVIGYRSAAGATPSEVLAAVEDKISGLILEAMRHPDGPLAGASEMAAKFLRGWWGEPPSPPFAALSGANGGARRSLFRSRLRNRFGQFGEELSGLGVDGVNDRADHAAGEQDLVDVADVPVALESGDRPLAEIRVLVGLANGNHAAVAGDQVRTDDDTGPVIFEALCGIDTADLAEPAVHRRPQRAWRSLANGPVAIHIPRPRPVANPHVVHEPSVRVRLLTPWPAKSGRHSCRRACCELVAQDVFHFPWRLGDRDLEMFVAGPRFGTAFLEAQQP